MTVEELVNASWQRHNPVITAISEKPESWPQLAEAMRRVAAGAGVNLDYSLASVQDLEDLLLDSRPLVARDGAMSAVIAGCYLGETLIRCLGGKWLYRAEGLPYVELNNGIFRANVIGKCSRLLETGDRSQESLVAMADSARDFSRYSPEQVQSFMDRLHTDKTICTEGYTVQLRRENSANR